MGLSHLLFLMMISFVAVFLPAPALGQKSSTNDFFEKQQERMEQLRADSDRRMQQMRERHNQTIDRLRGGKSPAFEDAIERSNKRLEEMKADAEAFRQDPDAFFKKSREKIGMNSQAFDERMEAQEDWIREAEQQNASDSGGRSYRIRGRTIRGLLMILGLLGAGVMKVFGFFGGKNSQA